MANQSLDVSSLRRPVGGAIIGEATRRRDLDLHCRAAPALRNAKPRGLC
jgi:hypothetical protein